MRDQADDCRVRFLIEKVHPWKVFSRRAMAFDEASEMGRRNLTPARYVVHFESVRRFIVCQRISSWFYRDAARNSAGMHDATTPRALCPDGRPLHTCGVLR